VEQSTITTTTATAKGMYLMLEEVVDEALKHIPGPGMKKYEIWNAIPVFVRLRKYK